MKQQFFSGYFCYLMALFSTVIGDVVMKLLAAKNYSPFLVSWMRTGAVFILAGFYFFPRLKTSLKTKHKKIQLLRAFVLILSGFLAVFSLKANPLAYHTVLLQLSPAIIALGAVIVLKERATWWLFGALAVSFFGALLIVGISFPGFSSFDFVRFLPFVLAVLIVIFSLATRWLTSRIKQEDLLVNYFFFAGAASTLALPFGEFLLEMEDLGVLLLLPVANLITQFCLIKSYAMIPASRLAPFFYLQLVMATIFGVIIFEETISGRQIIGGLLIFAGGLLVMLNNRKISKDA